MALGKSKEEERSGFCQSKPPNAPIKIQQVMDQEWKLDRE